MPETCAVGAFNYLSQLSAREGRARVNFLIALLEIDKHGCAGKLVDRNPLQLLREAGPKWHPAARSRQISTRRTNYLDFVAQQDESRRVMSEILNQWATECWLVESDQDEMLRPAGWVVAFAEQQLSRVDIGSDEPVRWAERFWESGGGDNEGHVALPSAEGTTVRPTGMFVPMDYPSPRVDESWKEFRKRARSAMAEHLRFCERSADFTSPSELGTGRSAARTPRRKRDGLEHYRYLILYQCCGWSLERIGKLHNLSAQAVSQGLREKAEAVGISVRSQALKRKSRKSAETGH